MILRFCLSEILCSKKKFEKLAVEAFHKKLLRLAVADEITRDVEVSEDVIMEFDKKIKRKIVKRLEKF